MFDPQVRPARYRSDEDIRDCVPIHAIWEITLACDLRCKHCGSRAGRPRPNELSTVECLEVIEALARLGTREVNLIGGEAYLRPDWIELVQHIKQCGMRCLIQTGGRNFSSAFVSKAVQAGLHGLGVSLDGMQNLHDEVRGVSGSFDKAVATLRCAHAAGLSTSVNTQIGRKTAKDLNSLLNVLVETGTTHWQLQLTVAMGNAADHDDLLLQPYELLQLMPRLAALYEEAKEVGVLIVMGNNIGYFGPYEHLWRGFGDERIHWTGCSGGHNVIALESDGRVKGCPSLESSDFGAGNVRSMRLEDILLNSERIRFSRHRSSQQLWGFCGSCYYKDICLGGCTWTSHSLLGRPGNNPYCHYRVLRLAENGLQERVVKIENAPGVPFGVARFGILKETTTGKFISLEQPTPRDELLKIPFNSSNGESARKLGKLDLCRACHEYVLPMTTICPHCNSNVEEAHTAWNAMRAEGMKALDRLESALAMDKTNSHDVSEPVGDLKCYET